MKKIILSGFVVVTFLGYAFIDRKSTSAQLAVTVPEPVKATATPVATDTTVATKTPEQAGVRLATPVPTPQGQYKDGEYVGSEADAFYGIIQVKAIVSGGRIADVQFLQYPNDRGTSIMINSQAMPYLRQEAIQAQSANVNIVSGATDSSQAFRQSLAAALSNAKN